MKEIHDNHHEECHFHTPSKKTGRLHIILDFILHSRRLVSFRSMTGRCSSCGKLIRAPGGIRRYYQLLTLFAFSLQLIISYLLLKRIDSPSTGEIFLLALIPPALGLIEGLLIPACILGARSWTVIADDPRFEDKAMEEELDRNGWNSSMTLCVIFGVILFLILMVALERKAQTDAAKSFFEQLQQ